MATALDKPITREVTINGEVHTVTLSGAGVIVKKKRARNGVEVSWAKLVRLVDEVQ